MIYITPKNSLTRALLYRYRMHLLHLFANRSKDKTQIQFWQDKLLYLIFLYGISSGAIILLACILIQIFAHRSSLIYVEPCIFLGVMVFSLYPGISLKVRRRAMAFCICFFAFYQLFIQGQLLIACLYFMAFSIFCALQFNSKTSYQSLIFVFTVLGISILSKYLHLFSTKNAMNLSYLSISWLNMVFINFLIVLLIRHTLKGFENKMRKKELLFKALKIKLKEYHELEQELKESEKHYRNLFFDSPSSMIIYDQTSCKIIVANQAACELYGYNQAEFGTLSLSSLFSQQDVLSLNDTAVQYDKHGEALDVKIKTLEFAYKGEPCKLIVVHDITELVNKQRSIELQNAALRDISFAQSHIVRVPLANILGLVSLLRDHMRTSEEEELYELLDESAAQLDSAIQETTQKCNDLLIAIP